MVAVPSPRNALAASQQAISGGSRNLAPSEQKRTAPLRTAKADADAFGASVGRGMQQLGRGAMDAGDAAFGIYDRMQKEREEIDVKEREIALRRQYREIENQYLGTGQRATVDGWGGFQDSVDKITAGASEGLSEEAAKRIRIAALTLGESTLDRGQKHYIGQSQTYRATLAQTRIDEARNEVLRAPADSTVLAQARRTARAESDALAEINGWDVETAARDRIERASSMTRAAVESLIETDPLGAEALLNRADVERAMTPEDQQAIRDKVESAKQAWQVDTATSEFRNSDELRDALKPAEGDAVSTPMSIASELLGQHEGRDHEAIAKFLEKAGGAKMDPAQQAWCARYLNSVFAAAGVEGTGSDMARSFLEWGTETKAPAVGDVVVLWRESPDSTKGHVGLYAGRTEDGRVRVLAGNQGDAVTIKSWSADKVLGYRKPPKAPEGASDPRFAGMSAAAQELAFSALDRKARARAARMQQDMTDAAIALEGGIADRAEYPSRDEIIGDLGGEVGAPIADALDTAAQAGDDLRTIRTMDRDEAMTLRRSIAADATTRGNDEADVQRLAAFDDALERHAKAVQADPAGVAIMNDDETARMIGGMANMSPMDQGYAETVREVARRSVAAQVAKGVMGYGADIRPLPQAIAAGMTEVIEKTPPEQIGPLLTEWRRGLGDHYFEGVLEQMITDHKLTGDAIPLALFSDNQIAMRVLKPAMTVSHEDAKKALETGAMTDIRESLQEELAPYLMAIGADDPDGIRRNQGLATRDILERAIVAQVMSGRDPETALANVLDATVRGGYTIIAEDGGHKVIADSRTVDEDTLQSAMDIMMRADRVAGFNPAFIGSDPVDQALMDRFNARDGFFVTSGDGQSAVMALEINGVAVPIRGEDGKPYGFRFDEAARIVKAADRQTMTGDRSRQNYDVDPNDPSAAELIREADRAAAEWMLETGEDINEAVGDFLDREGDKGVSARRRRGGGQR